MEENKDIFTKPSVLVLMSSYNGQEYIEAQIDSIFLQEDCIVSILVRDDGSTDQTKEILKKYEHKSRLKWYTGDNLKSAKSYIDLLINCPKKYDFYAFADQDDIWDSDKLSIGIQHIKSMQTPVIYCSNALLVDKHLKSLNEYVYKHSPCFNLQRVLVAGEIQGATMIFNKSLAEYFTNFKMPKYIPMHDYFVATICCCIGGKIIFDPSSHMKYRQHTSNVLGVRISLKDKVIRNTKRILKKSSFSDLQDFSRQILLCCTDINGSSREILELCSDYKRGIRNRIKLAFFRGLTLGKLNQAITYRLAILLGNL